MERSSFAKIFAYFKRLGPPKISDPASQSALTSLLMYCTALL